MNCPQPQDDPDGQRERCAYRQILMTTTRADIIDRSVEKAHIWVNDLPEEFGTVKSDEVV